MPRTSINIVIILVLLNGGAVLAAQLPVTDQIGYQPEIGGGDEITEAQSEGEEIQSDRSSLDEFVGGVLAAAGVVTDILGVAVAGPVMLTNLGAPAPVVAFLAGPLYIAIALDLLYVLSGRASL